MPLYAARARTVLCTLLLLPIAACSAPEETSQANCDTLVSETSADTMHSNSEASPQCASLAKRFDTQCMADLGKSELTGECRSVARTFEMRATKKIEQEQLCTIAGMHLPEK